MMFVLIVLLSSLLSPSSYGYTPTVESLFKHSSNKETLTNTIYLNLKVTKRVVDNNEGLLNDVKTPQSQFYQMIAFKNDETYKLVQAKYKNSKFRLNDLVEKIYYPRLSILNFKSDVENLERGLFFNQLISLFFGSGKEIITFLKSFNVPVKLNEEILNEDKLSLLSKYKEYLIKIKNNKKLKNTEENPLRPRDKKIQDEVAEILKSPMYTDIGQVKIGKLQNRLTWNVQAGPLEALFSYKKRNLIKLLYSTSLGQLEMDFNHYHVASGINRYPSSLTIKVFTGDVFDVEILNIKNINETEDSFLSKINKMDDVISRKKSLRSEVVNMSKDHLKSPPFLFFSQP